jgi:hypothetical protein
MDNKPVFTTKFVIEDRSEIIYVAHDKEGDWQFFSREDASEQDARIISINEILELDGSLKGHSPPRSIDSSTSR